VLTCADNPILFDLCADAIEQGVIRAYVQLVFQDEEALNSRPVVVMRLGPLDVHVSETRPKDATFGLPPFWIEVFDRTSQASIDSIGFHEVDDAELAAAVEMIVSAAGNRKPDDPAELRALLGRSKCSSTGKKVVGDKKAIGHGDEQERADELRRGR
jgi:hypothetical protein